MKDYLSDTQIFYSATSHLTPFQRFQEDASYNTGCGRETC